MFTNRSSRVFSQTSTSPNNSFMQEDKLSLQICAEHNKKQDIICVDCRQKICSHCALFSKHKNHCVKSEEDVMKEITGRAEKLEEIIDNIEKS